MVRNKDIIFSLFMIMFVLGIIITSFVGIQYYCEVLGKYDGWSFLQTYKCIKNGVEYYEHSTTSIFIRFSITVATLVFGIVTSILYGNMRIQQEEKYVKEKKLEEEFKIFLQNRK